MKTCIFDIETAPLRETDIANLAPKFEAPSNYKDADKIAAHIAEQKKAWLERAALSPLTGTVAAIGGTGLDEEFIMLATDEGQSEAIIIARFWDYFRAHYQRTMFVGFNIIRFDLPFLVRRSWKLKVPVPIGVRDGRYFSHDFVDLMELWQLGNREERISLDNLSKYLGVGTKSGSGADFYKCSPAEQRAYLSHDLKLTKLCADRLLTGVIGETLI